MKLKTSIKAALATGAATLIVSGGAMAAAVPLTQLSAHSATNPNTATALEFTVNNGAFFAGATFDANGNLDAGAANQALIQATSTCAATNVTCTLLDGSGDGMLQYLVKNTTNGKTFINLLVGQKGYDDGDANGVFFNETYVTYNGNSPYSANSMANRAIIKDGLAVANAEGGMTLGFEWLRGAFQTLTNSFTLAVGTNGVSGGNAGGQAVRMDGITDQLINGVQAFHYEGMSEENGAPGANGAANSIAYGLTIDMGGAGTQVANAADAQAMGVFAYEATGGTLVGGVNYQPNATTITLGTNSISTSTTAGNGARAVYVGQQMSGFNGSQTDSYATDDRTKRDFGYVRYTTTAGAPSNATGSFTDTQLGVGTTLQSIAMTSQFGTNSVVTGTTAPSNTVRETDYLGTAPNGANVNDFTTAGAGGEFVNSAGLLTSWTSLFGGSAPTNVDNGF